MPDDPVAATLAGAKQIEDFRHRHHHSHTSNPRRDYCSADNQDWPCDVASLLAAVLELTEPDEEESSPPQPESLWSGLLGYDPPACRNPTCSTHFPAAAGTEEP